MVPKVSTVSQIVAVLLCRFKVLPEMNEQKRTLKYKTIVGSEKFPPTTDVRPICENFLSFI